MRWSVLSWLVWSALLVFVALVAGCSDAPLIERQARRVVLVEVFSSTG